MVREGTRSPRSEAPKLGEVGGMSAFWSEVFKSRRARLIMNFPAAAAALEDLLVNAGFQWSQTTAPSFSSTRLLHQHQSQSHNSTYIR